MVKWPWDINTNYILAETKFTRQTAQNLNTLSACTFVFLAHSNFSLGTSIRVMWRAFGWRSRWVTKQSRLVFPARGVRDCFMLPCWDRKLRGKQRESHTLTRKIHSAFLHSTRRDSCDYLLPFPLSLSPIHTRTHAWMPWYPLKYTCACTGSLISSAGDKGFLCKVCWRE